MRLDWKDKKQHQAGPLNLQNNYNAQKPPKFFSQKDLQLQILPVPVKP
jgi:hypothetical protein